MTEDAVYAMLLDLLRNDSTITAIVGAEGIRFAKEELPTDTPVVYLGEPEGASDEQWSDNTTIQLECTETTRALAWELASAVNGILDVRADTSSFDASIRGNHPTVKLHSIIKTSSIGQTYPTKNGATIYSALLKYEVRGKG